MAAAFDIESIVLDAAAATNLHRQLYSQLRGLIQSRALASGTALPSTRILAGNLKIGRNTVIAAYDQLALEGFVRMRKGAPPLVVDLPARSAPAVRPDGGGSHLSERGMLLGAQRYHHGEPGHLVFHPGMPDPDNFPFNTWSKLLARRAKMARKDLFGVYHIEGYPDLREALARYLTVSRGVNCAAEQIVVTNGAQSAFDLLARVLIDPGDTVWMEEPGYYGASAAFRSAGASLEPLRVGPDGWQLAPPKTVPRLIFVTPSCHHPLGVTMPMEQRLNLIRLAERWNAWIIEDDYDSEYRFQGQTIPALQGLDLSNRVVYVGTFAKILFPAMRLGFMVMPPEIGNRATAALSATGHFAPLLTQAALADFMGEGHLTRHLRRMRRLYAARRQFFIESCDEHLRNWLHLRPTGSGIQIVGYFQSGQDDQDVAARAREQGINVQPLSIHYQHGWQNSGLVMGFASSDERATRSGMQTLRQVLS
jgi:GntR family transcriptional regulator/MocR family aminotransferase